MNSLRCIRALVLGLMVPAAFLISGCSPSSPSSPSSPKLSSPEWRGIDRLEIYYRGFSQLAPVKFYEEDLVRSASTRVVLEGGKDIAEVIEDLSLPCSPVSDVGEGDMDLYVLIRGFERNGRSREWKASPFHFYDSAVGKVCTFRLEDRERLSAAIQTAAHR